MNSTEPRDSRAPEPSQTEFEFPVSRLRELSGLGQLRGSSSGRSGGHRLRGAAPSQLARHAGIAEFAITLMATLAFGLGWAAFELGGERAGESGSGLGVEGWVQHTGRGEPDGSVYAGAAGGAIGAPTNAGRDSAIHLDDDLNRRGTTQWTTRTTTARMPKLIGSPRTSSDLNKRNSSSDSNSASNSSNSNNFGPAGEKSKP